MRKTSIPRHNALESSGQKRVPTFGTLLSSESKQSPQVTLSFGLASPMTRTNIYKGAIERIFRHV